MTAQQERIARRKVTAILHELGRTYHDGLPADIEQSRAKSADMLWMGTEPCYRAETNAHITAFFQRNACRLIEDVAAKQGIDLQAEMRKSDMR